MNTLKKIFSITLLTIVIGFIALKFGVSRGLAPHDPPQWEFFFNPLFFPLGNQTLASDKNSLLIIGLIVVITYWYTLATLIYFALRNAMRRFKKTESLSD